MTNTLNTVADWWRYTTSFLQQAQRENRIFFGHGCTNAMQEALWLVLETLYLPIELMDSPQELAPFLPATLLPHEAERIVQGLQKRITPIPMPYVLGCAYVHGLRFLCDERALIPRSFLIELLRDEEAMNQWLPQEHLELWLSLAAPLDSTFNSSYATPLRILDLCCGAGSIAISAALAFPQALVEGIDISQDALDLAVENLHYQNKQVQALHGIAQSLANRVRFLQADLNTWQPPSVLNPVEQYALILCNPPYVNNHSMANLPPEYAYEPQQALAGGEDGMDLIAIILQKAATALRADGILLLEIGNEYDYFLARFPHIMAEPITTAGGDTSVLKISAAALHSLPQ